MSPPSYGIAVIGLGRIGQIHASNIASQDRFALLHLIDADTAIAGKLANRYDAASSDLDVALCDERVQGIVIASPTAFHVKHIDDVIAAEKAIFCEKPLDLDLNSAAECAARIDKSGLPFLLGFNRRFDPQFSAVKTRLDRGDIGRVESLHIISHDPSPPPLSYIKSSGGLFKDMAIHDFDMARWLMQANPVSVYATGGAIIDPEIGKVGDIDTAKTILTFPGDRHCVISNSRRAVYGYDQRVEIFGSHGNLRVGNVIEDQLEWMTDQSTQSAKPQYFFTERYAKAYKNEMSHFADLLSGKPPHVTAQDGVAALRIADSAAESLRQGRPVKLEW